MQSFSRDSNSPRMRSRLISRRSPLMDCFADCAAALPNLAMSSRLSINPPTQALGSMVRATSMLTSLASIGSSSTTVWRRYISNVLVAGSISTLMFSSHSGYAFLAAFSMADFTFSTSRAVSTFASLPSEESASKKLLSIFFTMPPLIKILLLHTAAHTTDPAAPELWAPHDPPAVW